MKRYLTCARFGIFSRALQTSDENRSGGGWLATALFFAMIGTASAVDVPLMVVLKGQSFSQSGPTIVALSDDDFSDDEESLLFEAFAQGDAADSIVSGTLGLPGGGSVPLVREEPGSSEFQYEYQAETLLELNTSKPNGTYTFNLTTKNDGDVSVAVDLTGNSYPNVPQITNFNTLQAATHTAVINVEWEAMGGTTNDFIMCNVFDRDTGASVYRSGEPGSAEALDGTAVQAVIPAGWLSPGKNYEAEVLFVKVANANNTTYAGATAVAGYYKLVEFSLKTAPMSGFALGATFEGAVPQPYGWDVARDSAVSFRFSHPMNPGFRSVSWTGVNPANFGYEWIDGNKVLRCRYIGDLPPNANIEWSLDLTGFRDAENFALTGTEEGSFHTLSDAGESPPDVQGIYVVKARSFIQTGTSPPVSDGMYFCEAEVEFSAYNRVEAATMTMVANSRSMVLERDQWDPGMEMEAEYASKTDFDRFFTNGNFRFDLTTLDDGPQSVTLSLDSSDDYPAAPTVTNLVALQTIDPATPTTITWTALAGWNSTPTAGGGMIDLEIDNSQDNEVFWVDSEDLSSGSQYVIPAGTLWPGRTYQVSLNFTKLKDLDNTSYTGVLAGAGFSSFTEFTIQTTGTPVLPKITVAENGDAMNLDFMGGEPQRRYVIESSRDFSRWLPLEERWLDGGPNSYYDDDARYVGFRFYRLRDRLADEQVRRNVSIQGTVWTDNTHTTPVAGAVVGTDLDAQTIVTDIDGHFFLETDTQGNNGVITPYTITVKVGVTTKNHGPWNWGDQPREQHFEQN